MTGLPKVLAALAALAVLALAALSHVITTGIAVLASLPLLLRRKGTRTVVGSWALGFAVAGFWAVPFLWRAMAYMTDMGWTPRTDWLGDIFPRDMWPVLVLGAAGLAWAIARRVLVGPAVTLLVVGTAGYWIIAWVDFTKLYNGRLLPFYYYSAYLFAGIFITIIPALDTPTKMAAAGGLVGSFVQDRTAGARGSLEMISGRMS